ncbi:cation:proton antiporter [Enterococcus xiangfangensis]|uniref:cation:proton antiporter n=1 Tax=Enterococcus xiangfangensis TaxID=1296537 RepID=UPI0010F584E0|nr:sodium:proton antiporter [Enterococcus xiangfangensis]MBM7710443.1 CPA1 family monovalent cation:H+ antiporter [Enterococcus xiangfangensis]
MGLIEIIIIVAIAITLSNVLAKVFPSFPIFMIQIIIGIIIGFTEVGSSIHFEPEVFLVMIIAPLLFREGETADIASILKHFGLILLLAFGGVIFTLFGLGFVLHKILPIIPLAACLAFGASLGPTDAVAVNSLAKRLNIPESVMHVLEGEGLINDATGVTAFQFAVAALLTGRFSAMDASISLLESSIVGVLVGLVIIWVKNEIIKIIERISAQDVSAYLLIELILPFTAYFIAELFHASGIIAAVVTGVLQATGFRRVNLFEAQLSNVTESTWDTISFMLNALVFIFLGIELSQVFSPVWNSQSYSNLHLLGIVLLLTALLFVLRFLFVSGFYVVTQGWQTTRSQLRERLLLTFGGVKGTVSIATIFILPTTIHGLAFPERSLLLFITACVTFLTLIIGMILLPILSEGEVIPPTDPKLMLILREVISELYADLDDKKLSEKERFALLAVIANYQGRIQQVFNNSMPESAQQEFQEIQALIISVERDGLDESFRRHQIDASAYRLYSRFISNVSESVTKQMLSLLSFWLIFVRRIIRIILHPKMFWQRKKKQKEIVDNRDISSLRKIFIRNSEVILDSLENLRDVYDEDLIDFFVDERKNLMNQVSGHGLFGTHLIQQDPLYVKELIRGFYLERKLIDQYEANSEITNFTANNYRHQVNQLESYTMRQSSDPSFSFVLKRQKKRTKETE